MSSSLLGRDAQLQALSDALLAAGRGDPRVVLVEAEPGMGKSALLDEFSQTSVSSGRLVRVACDAYEQEVPFSAASLLLPDLPQPETPPVSVGTQLLRVLGDLQDQAAAAVVIVDDVHWMDAPSVAALRFALRRLRADRVLAVLARRPPVAEDPWSALVRDTARTAVLGLDSLDLDAVIDLARRERGWNLSAAVADQLVRHTGGVPLLLSTFLRGAPADALAEPAGPLPVPTSTSAAVRRVLLSLDADARMLLKALAVIGETTPVIPLAQVAGVSDVSAALPAALSTGLAVVDETSGATCVHFRHDLLRTAVYDGMTPGVRRDLHVRAVDVTSGEQSLRHRVAAADQPDAELARTLVALADADATDGRESLAATRLLQASAVTADPVRRDEWAQQAMIHRVRAGDLRSAATLTDTVTQAAPSARRSHALGLLGRELGDLEKAAAFLEDAVTRADEDGDAEAAERATVDLADLYTLQSRGPETIRAATRGLGSADPWVARSALWHLALGRWTTGDLDGALRELEIIPAAADATRHDADSLSARAALRVFAGDLVPAHDDLDGAIRLATANRRSVTLYRSYIQRSNVRIYLGRWDEAAIDASNAIALAENGDSPWDLPIAHGVAVQVPAGRGQWDVAEHHLAEAMAGVDRARAVGSSSHVSAAMSLAIAREDFAAVLEAALPMLEPLLARPGTPGGSRWLYTGSIQAYVRLGRIAEAEALLARYEQVRNARGGHAGISRLGWLRGMLAEARGDARAAQAAYAEDLADPALGEVPLAKANLLNSAGRLERALGNRREAVDLLRQARDLFAQLRATPYLVRCDADLARAGLVVVRESPLALTQREQDVAALVARGLTNPEAAAELYVTPKTVEYHLRNVYAKLGITSRRELRSRLAA